MTSVGCCVLCLVTFKDPRILPTCGHTFCLNCIKQYGQTEKTELPCPMCRTKSRIPSGGLEEFPKNYSLSDVLDSCAFVGIEEPVRMSSSAKVAKPEGFSCSQHPENELQLYCIECCRAICLECVDTGHGSHKLCTISKVAADARIQLQNDMERMIKKLSQTKQERDKIVDTKTKLLCLFAERELDIKKEHERIKSCLEEQKKTLDLELITLKANLLKQLEVEKRDVEAEELSLSSFTNHVKQMIDGQDKRANFKVVESLKDLNSRSRELMQMKTKEPGSCRIPTVSFKPADILNTSFANKEQNLIGTIEVNINLSNDDSTDQFCDSTDQFWSPSTFAGRGVRSLRPESRLLDAIKETASAAAGKMAVNKADDDKKDDDDNHCIICMDEITDKKELPCKHKFCRECIDQYFSKGLLKCPSCGKVFGTLRGDQPRGTMTTQENNWQHLPGYHDCGTIEINYSFDNGLQGDNHPNPGQPYRGTHRTAYLPANKEGREVLHLLKRAFDAGLVFTIGQSNTTSQNNVVIWNNIHHKTSQHGQYGYPDATYLKRVKEELAAKGIQ